MKFWAFWRQPAPQPHQQTATWERSFEGKVKQLSLGLGHYEEGGNFQQGYSDKQLSQVLTNLASSFWNKMSTFQIQRRQINPLTKREALDYGYLAQNKYPSQKSLHSTNKTNAKHW